MGGMHGLTGKRNSMLKCLVILNLVVDPLLYSVRFLGVMLMVTLVTPLYQLTNMVKRRPLIFRATVCQARASG